jgi:MraZ protein
LESFTGEFHHTIDAKGRLIVPARVREELVNNELTLTVWTEDCISLWTGEGWSRLKDQLVAQRKGNPNARAAVRQIFSQAFKGEVDKQGRIVLPQHLRDFAGIDKEVVIAGVGDHAEIWSPERYDRTQAAAREQGLDAVFAQLDI